MFFRGSYFFIIVDETINKTLHNAFNIGLNWGTNYKAVLKQGIDLRVRVSSFSSGHKYGREKCRFWYYSQPRSRVNSISKNEMNIRISLCNVRRVNGMLDISLEIVPKKTH